MPDSTSHRRWLTQLVRWTVWAGLYLLFFGLMVLVLYLRLLGQPTSPGAPPATAWTPTIGLYLAVMSLAAGLLASLVVEGLIWLGSQSARPGPK
jgi:hypothetical protein